MDQQSGLPWWVAPLGLIALIGAWRSVLRPLSDPDTFWHLRLGQKVTADWSLQHPDWNPGGPEWTPSEWLSEVVMYQAYRFAGYPGVVIWQLSAILILVLALYWLARQRTNPFGAVLTLALLALSVVPNTAARPQLVSYALLAFLVTAWLKIAADHQPRWWLIPMCWIWAMAHGMWIVGVITTLALAVAVALDNREKTGADSSHQQQKLIRNCIIIISSCLLAVSLTPLTWRVWRNLVSVGSVSQYVTEWAPNDFRTLSPAITAILVAGVVVWLLRQTRPALWVEVALLAMAVGWILFSQRTLVLGAILLCPLVAAGLQSLLVSPVLRAKWSDVAITAVAVGGLVLGASSARSVAAKPTQVPSQLSSELDQVPRDTCVLNSYEVGGYLRWAHPQTRPFIDGMSDAYTPEDFARYVAITQLAPGWQDLVADTGCQYALIGDDAPLRFALQESFSWQLLSQADGYSLLLAPS
jgi:hypothetical protein